jgi:hypothetical protein
MLSWETIEALEASGIGVWVRESTWGFALVVGGHILGLALSVGTLAWFDLRLLGLGVVAAPVSRTFRRLMPVFTFGFISMFVTGIMLFAAYATKAYYSTLFRVKLVLILLAGANALYYHLFTEKSIAQWDTDQRVPRAARLAGACSLLLWVAIILLGRGMAYTMFNAY